MFAVRLTLRYTQFYALHPSQRSPERAKSPPKPNFGNSGLLAAESNTVKVSSDKASKAGTPDVTGVVLKYHEPPEARKPTKSWRLYVFKGKEQVGKSSMFKFCGAIRLLILIAAFATELIQIHKQSAYLVGRDRIVGCFWWKYMVNLY
jgi:smad nuclear-interacting protein 1